MVPYLLKQQLAQGSLNSHGEVLATRHINARPLSSCRSEVAVIARQDYLNKVGKVEPARTCLVKIVYHER